MTDRHDDDRMSSQMPSTIFWRSPVPPYRIVPIDVLPIPPRDEAVDEEEEEEEMSGTTRSPRQARVLNADQIERTLDLARASQTPESGELKILLSFYAGLRVNEIASLNLDAVTDADGRIGPSILIPRELSKGGRARVIPMHPLIRAAFIRFRRRYPDLTHFAICGKSLQRQSVNGLTQWFRRLYRDAGLSGCSSHSGRRSFITNLARCANQYQTSLCDVQALAGHARLDTTQTYIEPSTNIDALVRSLGPRPTNKTASRTQPCAA